MRTSHDLPDRDRYWGCLSLGWAARTQCQYCGSRSRLTVDHVVPKSRGGDSGWHNVVTSCAPCNARKGSALCHEIEMFPKRTPRPPSPDVFIDVVTPIRPEAWTPYLATAA